MPNQASVKPEVNANAGREMYTNAYQLQRLKKKKSLAYALGEFLFIMPFLSKWTL